MSHVYGMARKMIDTHISEEEEGEHPSRGDARVIRRRTQDRLEAVGLRLTTLDDATLEKLELGEAVEEAVRELARLRSGSALPRQRRRIAGLLRGYPLDELEARVEMAIGADKPNEARTQRLERLREELLDSGSDALTRVFEEHPGADRQRLQQAVRAARREQQAGARGRRFKELFRVLKEVTAP